MTQQYFDYANAPEVRGDTVLVFNNKTSGAIHFGTALSEFHKAFLSWCATFSFLRTRHTGADEFLAMLPEDEELREAVYTAAQFITDVHSHTILIKDNNYTKEDKALSILRGLALLMEILNEETNIRDFSLFIRLSTNEVMKAVVNIDAETGRWDGKITGKKGWLVPVWSENEIELFT